MLEHLPSLSLLENPRVCNGCDEFKAATTERGELQYQNFPRTIRGHA